ncbi:conjugal transfer protein [Waltera sp.]|uniref:conjugal transfer protein n=1 Tax=Waltera sp. TaxID=2815806 RepID=UPI0039935412
MFKKKEKTEKAPKNKKVRTMKVGTHKKSVLLLWAVLLASTSFGVYKNFTAIDTHTVHEKEIIQLRLNDTNGIENFVKNFAKAYYSWDTSKEAIEARTAEISKYLTKELQDLNADTIRTDIPTSTTVTNVLVWNVTVWNGRFYRCLRSRSAGKGGEQTQAVTKNYTVTVHVDKDGAMVITQNPTLAPAMQKSKYEPKVQEADVSVSSDTVKDATAFLETFFKLYPTATEKELAYYVKDGVLAPVSGDYVFSELVNPVFTKDGDNLKVSVSVKYLDNKSKMTQISQYELVLHKDDNWKIVE